MSKPFITATVGTSASNGYGHVNIYFNAIVRETPTGGDRSPWDSTASGFYCDGGLQVSCQLDKDSNGPYGFRVGYAHVHFLECSKAEKSFKTLSKIEKALEKLRNELGSVQSFGDYVQRVCKILKVKEAQIGTKKCLPERVGSEADRIATELKGQL